MAAVKLVLIFILSYSYVDGCGIPPTFLSETSEMSTMCNETVDISSVRLLHGGIFNEASLEDLECVIRGRLKPQHRLIISLLEMYQRDSVTGLFCPGNNTADKIIVADTPEMLPATTEERCENMTKVRDWVSSTEEVSIHVYSNTSNSWDGIYLLVIPYHTGTCENNEQQCLNGRCIQGFLNCRDNYNDCFYGDCRHDDDNLCDYDYPDDDYYEKKLVIIVPICVVLAVIIIALVVWFCWWRIKCQKRRTLKTSQVATPVTFTSGPQPLTVVTAPAYTPPGVALPYTVLPVNGQEQKTEGDVKKAVPV